MFEKHLEESEAPTAQEVLFFASLLAEQGDVAKAASLLEGPIAQKVPNIKLFCVCFFFYSIHTKFAFASSTVA